MHVLARFKSIVDSYIYHNSHCDIAASSPPIHFYCSVYIESAPTLCRMLKRL